MPLLPPRPCCHPGCPTLVSRGYCERHAPLSSRAIDRRTKGVDPFYKSSTWLRLRAVVLRRSPLCVLCRAVASVVDHITARADGGAPYDECNLRSLCSSCHAKLPGHGFNRKESECRA